MKYRLKIAEFNLLIEIDLVLNSENKWHFTLVTWQGSVMTQEVIDPLFSTASQALSAALVYLAFQSISYPASARITIERWSKQKLGTISI